MTCGRPLPAALGYCAAHAGERVLYATLDGVLRTLVSACIALHAACSVGQGLSELYGSRMVIVPAALDHVLRTPVDDC